MELLNQMDGFDQNVNVKVGLYPAIVNPARSICSCCSPSVRSHAKENSCICVARCLADRAPGHGSRPVLQNPRVLSALLMRCGSSCR